MQVRNPKDDTTIVRTDDPLEEAPPRFIARHLAPKERVLAVVSREGLVTTQELLVATDERLLWFRKVSMFSWNVQTISPQYVQRVDVEHGIFFAKLTMVISVPPQPAAPDGVAQFCLDNLSKDEAARLSAAVHYLRGHPYPDALAPRWKRCPQCGDPMKEGTRVCQTCGHRV